MLFCFSEITKLDLLCTSTFQVCQSQKICNCHTNLVVLTHFMLLISFYTSWKYQDILKGYRKRPATWNALMTCWVFHSSFNVSWYSFRKWHVCCWAKNFVTPCISSNILHEWKQSLSEYRRKLKNFYSNANPKKSCKEITNQLPIGKTDAISISKDSKKLCKEFEFFEGQAIFKTHSIIQ